MSYVADSEYEKKIPESDWEDCPNCPNDGCYMEGGGVDYVTADMASDACMPEIEGERIEQEPDCVQCEFCWTNPKSVFHQKGLLEIKESE